MEKYQLAQLVIATLQAQKKYFQTRNHGDLIEAKKLEGQLDKAARAALNNDLFAEEEKSDR